MVLKKNIHYFLQSVIELLFSLLSYLFYILYPITKPLVEYFHGLSGIKIDGENPWDVKVKDNRFYGEVVAKGLTGLLDAYIEGYYECDDLEEMFIRHVKSKPLLFNVERYHPYRLMKYFVHRYFDVLTPDCIQKEANPHYEKHAGEIIEAFASTYQYSAMLMYDEKAVEEANSEELERMMEEGTLRARENIAKKLKLKPGMKVLDIGCGFGGLAKHLAEKYKVEVTGVTICRAMAENARKICKGLPVKIILDDYRSLKGKFDRIVSIEMFEHVGDTHHREYFEKVSSMLKEDGIFVFQAHSFHDHRVMSYTPMCEKSLEMYGYLPQLEEIVDQSRGLLVIENIESLGYCVGVMSRAVLRRVRLKKKEYLKAWGEREFRRNYIYGCIAVGTCITGKDRVYQVVFSKNGLECAI